MPRNPTITEAYEWIALNDEPDELDPEVVAETISVQLIADIFGRTPEHVGRKVVNLRKSMIRRGVN
jgi:hypothetical protein